MYVDSHCHLSAPELQSDWSRVRESMRSAGVDRALCICTTLEEFDTVHAIADADESLWCSVGVHPDNEGVQEPSVEDLSARAGRSKVVAIGETGLDYYRLGERTAADMGWQRERFRVHIRAARATGLPLVIHTRAASEHTLAILREEGGGAGSDAVRGVFHCFTETRAVARQALELGFLISFSGILTFKNASDLRAVAAEVPLERCLIETDSPYLAPMPHRGKTNNPSYVPLVAAELARIKACSVEEVASVTSANFERLFGPQVIKR